MHESRFLSGCHKKMLDFLGIPHSGLPQAPSDKFIPVKQVLPGGKAQCNLAIDSTHLT